MYLGIDVGTTSVCAVVINEQGQVVFTVTKPNDFGKDLGGGIKTQDAQGIYLLCKQIYDTVKKSYAIKSIGVSGQMHGILYVKDKNAISPLYSWQDGRGNLPYKNSTYATIVSNLSGYKLATGYGAVSMFYDKVNGLIPKDADCVCTIGDYVAMRLADAPLPVMNQTNAASIGLFDVKNGCWDKVAIEKCELPFNLFPETVKDVEKIGVTPDGASVYTAVGDNQASVYGALKDDDSVMVNVGTGSQISVVSNDYVNVVGAEVRPYFNGKFLVLGCALCGGHSYKILKDFFCAINKDVTYQVMNDWAKDAYDKKLPVFTPTFRGTRDNPNALANVTLLTENNFTPQTVTLALLKGISKELKDYFDLIRIKTGDKNTFVGAGNAIRLNPVLKRVVEDDYNCKLNVPKHKEEAAFGAALISAEKFENHSLKDFIKYE